MFDFIEAFVKGDRTMTKDGKYAKMGQSDELATRLIEEGQTTMRAVRLCDNFDKSMT